MKAKGTVVEYNVKTGKTTMYEKEFEFPDTVAEMPKGVDLEKLKQVLLNKGIIADPRELEPATGVSP